ncbi:RNA-binding protein 7 [Syngnathus scovelli]|uniref:RNA-binding protein 7 n=1 Tax=Syngnathus scovelli TaxID=161590 RepID=UPI00210FC66A|nr:RNA-binding protein 7 [Syngnathus scovelli]
MGIEDEADRTLFIRNLDTRVTEELLFELFLQAGPLIKTKIPKDGDGKQKTFGFAVYKHEESVPYALQLLNGTSLFGRTIHVQFRSGSTHSNSSGSASPSSTPNPHGLRVPQQFSSPQYTPPRSYSSPDSLQKHAMMNMMYQQSPNYCKMPWHPSAGGAGSFRQRDSAPDPTHSASTNSCRRNQRNADDSHRQQQQYNRNDYHQQNAWGGGGRHHDGRGGSRHYDDVSGNRGHQDSRWRRY